jgi:hypothetical protein
MSLPSGHRQVRWCGLSLSSVMPLPGPDSAGPDPDVSVDVRSDLEEQEGPRAVTWAAESGCYRIDWPRAFHLTVSGGRDVTVRHTLRFSLRDVTSLLAGPALAALLHQRGRWPLHAAVVARHNRAILLVGSSAAGKSNIAWSLLKRGWSFVADDIAALDGNPVGVWRGPAVVALAEADAGKERVTPPGALGEDRTTVALVVVLERRNGPIQCERLRGTQAVESLCRHVHLAHAAPRLGSAANHLPLAVRIASEVPVYRIAHPAAAATRQGVVDAVEGFAW